MHGTTTAHKSLAAAAGTKLKQGATHLVVGTMFAPFRGFLAVASAVSIAVEAADRLRQRREGTLG